MSIKMNNLIQIFQKDTPEYADWKVEFARRLIIIDLISCCNILRLEYNEDKKEVQ